MPEDVLEFIFKAEPGSTGGLAERLLQTYGEDVHHTAHQLHRLCELRERHEVLREGKSLSEKARNVLRVLGQALHEAHLSEHEVMVAMVRLGDVSVDNLQTCEGKIRALRVELGNILFPNGVPQDADPR